MGKQKSVTSPIDLSNWDQIVESSNNTINTSSTSILDSKLKEHVDYIENNSNSTWYPDEGYNALQNKIKIATYNEAKTKADEQGFFGEAKGFLAQAVVGEIVLGTVEGVGYLLDLEHWFDKLSGGEGDWGNWVSDLAAKGQENVAEFAPIFQDPDNETRSTWQNMIHGDGWWAQNGVSVASTVSLMIPVAGEARLAGWLGKGMSTFNKASKIGRFGTAGKLISKPIDLVEKFAQFAGMESKTGKLLTGSIHRGIVSRHLENTIEATEVYKQKYDEYINQGFSEEEAKTYAGKGASFTYNSGWALALQDIAQYALAGKKFNISKAATSAQLGKMGGQGIAKTIAMNVGRKSFDFLSEGVEEAYQFIVAEEGKHLADVQAGLVDPNESRLSDRLGKYYNDAELWTSAFFGGLGGNLFQASHNLVKSGVEGRLLQSLKGISSEEEARINEILTWKERNSQSIRDYYEALETDNPKAYEVAKQKMYFNTGVEAASMGNWAFRKQELLNLKNADPKEITEYFGVSEEDAIDFKNDIDTYIQQSEKAAQTFGVNASKYDTEIAYQVSYLQHMINSYTEKLPELNKNIDDLKQNITGINNMSVSGKAVFEQTLGIKALEKLVKSNETIIKKLPNISKEEIEYYTKENERYNSILEQTKTEINELKKEGLNQNDRTALGQLNHGLADELVSLELEKAYNDFYTQKWSSELDNIISEPSSKTRREKKNTVLEEIKKKKIKEQNDIIQKESKDKASNKPKLNLDKEELAVGSQEEIKEEELTSEQMFNKIASGEIPYDALPDPIKQQYEQWKSSKVVEEEYSKTENNAIKKNNTNETPDNPNSEEWDKGTDDTFKLITQIETPLAYLSVNNQWSEEKDISPENIALSNFLESTEPVSNIELRFIIDYDYLNASNNKGRKYFKEINNALQNKSNLTDEQLAVLPIRALMYSNNEPLEYNGYNLSMHLHNPSFFDNSDSKTFQVEKLMEHKRLIYGAFQKDKQLRSEIESKTTGKLNLDILSNGNYKMNSYLEVLNKSPENITLVYGDDTGSYLNANKKLSDKLYNLFTASQGAIYAITETPHGNPFPLRLQTTKVSTNEADLLYTLYVSVLSDPKLLKQAIHSTLSEDTDSIKNIITNSTDPRIAGIANYLNLDKITYQELISHLVYEGSTTQYKKESALYIDWGKTNEDGSRIPTSLIFGKNRLSVTELVKPENKSLFLEHITSNRNRQVDIKYLNNNEYKNYLDVNRILSTNIKPTSSANIFVQPVIKYKDELKEVEEIESIVEKKEPIIKIEEESSEAPISDMDKALNEALLKSLQNKSNNSDNFLDNLPDIDDTTGVFKLLKSDSPLVDITDEVKHIESLLPKDIAIQLTPGYREVLSKGDIAIGTFVNNMIIVSNIAPIGTAYHEAFHAVFRTLLSSKERGTIMEEIKSIVSTPSTQEIDDIVANNKVTSNEAIQIYYEEILADQFADYMINRNNIPSTKNKIQQFFSNLLEWINNVFKGNSITVDRLFNDISKEKYSNKQLISNKLNVVFKAKNITTAVNEDVVNRIINDPNTKLVDLNSLVENLVNKNKIRSRNSVVSKFERKTVNFLNKLGISDYTNEYNISDKELKNYYLNILNKIKPFIKDTKIYSYRNSRIDLIRGAAIHAGFANFSNEIYLGDITGLNLKTLVHELMHSVTQHALNEDSSLYDSKFHNSIKGLLKTAKENIKENYYGLSNEYEFIAEAFSNPEFQVALSKIKTGTTKSSNMFLDIINEISELFRRVFKLNIKSTLLEDVFDTVGNKLENTTDIAGYQKNNEISEEEWLSLSREEQEKIINCK